MTNSDLPFVWTFLGLVVAGGVVLFVVMEPGLRRERRRPGRGGADRPLRFVLMFFMVGLMVVASADTGGFRWSRVPAPIQGAALALVAAGYALVIWAIRHNRFYSPVVRIQSERGHALVTSGPYARIRHPGYAASLLVVLATGPAVGSWWAVLPGLAASAFIFRRIRIEEPYLREHLPGYAAYAKRVRWRLVPGVW